MYRSEHNPDLYSRFVHHNNMIKLLPDQEITIPSVPEKSNDIALTFIVIP